MAFQRCTTRASKGISTSWYADPVDPFDLCHHSFPTHSTLPCAFYLGVPQECWAKTFTGDDVGDGPARAQFVGCLELTKH